MKTPLLPKDFLDKHYKAYNTKDNISAQNPDPLLVVRQYKNHQYFAEIALFCALLSYGNAKEIVKFLSRIDFTYLDSHFNARHKESLACEYPQLYYRFQNAHDMAVLFHIFARLIANGGIKKVFMQGFKHKHYTPYRILNAIYHSISFLREYANDMGMVSYGIDFALGSVPKDLQSCCRGSKNISFNAKTKSPLKRWNMFARWLVRKDNIDFGIWSDEISPHELIIPLDTHTFRLGREIGCISRKSADLYSAIELTEHLKTLCKDDPIKYDFVLYRLGQQYKTTQGML